MNQRLTELRERIRDFEHKAYRQAESPDVVTECEAEELSWSQRMARRTRLMCEAETPVIEPGDQIVFLRTLPKVPPIFTQTEMVKLQDGRTVHAWDSINNISPDWGIILSQGLLGRKQVALETKERMKDDPEAVEFIDAAVETIDAVLELTKRYAAKALEAGREDLADMLEWTPAKPARNFHEALQSLRIMHSMIYIGGNYHVGLGRFDQYMWPYLETDLRDRRLTAEQAEDLLTEFFLALNKDTDLYGGIMGDNGQTIVLGGVKRDGTDAVNPLTWMSLRVSKDIGMIDPKINLRITPETDLALLCLASELTQKGLGFPQYSNDDVVIPALVEHGYELEDARDYAVAACWEFIMPGKGMEIVNINWVSFPEVTDKAIREGIAAGDDFDGILARVATMMKDQVETKLRPSYGIDLPPAPYFSVVMGDCLERGKDLGKGLKYNNYGVFGACSANAADALAAVKKFVFDEKSVKPEELIAALDANYEGYEDLHRKLSEEAPKVGNNEPESNEMLKKLYDLFADACEAFGPNGRGGKLRPGTGTAMLYVTIAKEHGATAEGRKAGEYFAANLAPSPNAKLQGPISVLQSYSVIDYKRVFNGGPITMELSESVFDGEESIRKVAMLIRTFAQLGCQQLQLNTLNYEKLVEAKANPEQYKNLIVRVWGWSGYFTELPPEYQEHVIKRHMYAS